ncbi:hypothetical protein TNIN_402091 [Trichonephila inaurata madagascariensis]|uniref:Uncharacterized protein n=1 Tax=Trichonephila inaurata madagascariensis TaxID=2747483 RepID=A0A8X6JCF4_9ARAC|nr:hypothetical protein TNIN_402091 [Trichonephila inaurata madagascariensis]
METSGSLNSNRRSCIYSRTSHFLRASSSTQTLTTCGLVLSCRMMTPDDSILGRLFLIALCSISSDWVYRWAWMETSGSLNSKNRGPCIYSRTSHFLRASYSTQTLTTCGLVLSCRTMTPDDSILGLLILIALCSISSVWVYRWAWMETSGFLNSNNRGPCISKISVNITFPADS